MGKTKLGVAIFLFALSLAPQSLARADNGQFTTLEKLITEALNNPEGHIGALGGSGIFSGSVDWHSSVHGNWAILSMARVLGHPELAEKALTQLTEKNLRLELKYLKANPDFELPYGRSWFALLLSELSRHPGRNTPGLQKMRYTIEADLMSWLEKMPFPEGDEYNANYDSVLLTTWMLELSKPVSPETPDRLVRIFRDKIEPRRAALEDQPYQDYDFLSLPLFTP